ncbi:ANKEF1 [Symbiodinium natans]|uniref:ANKEF1 protein n=1 Tax=Symbiodinium natans TaxID=878477 RepID=A0A812JIJ5_9DINO|nr:ANKEF1 [Symbiodinium natans]
MAERSELEHDFLDNAKSFNWPAVKTMLQETPDLINVQPSNRWTALHQAAYEGNAEIVNFLLEKGADPDAQTRSGQTPAEVAKGQEVRRAIEAKAGADEPDEPDEPPKKKAKKMPNYNLNINSAVDKEYEGSSLTDIVAAPTSALQGVGPKGRDVLKKFKLHTIGDLASWKFYRISKSILGLSTLEQKGKREEGAALNINKAMDKKHECKSLAEILELPPSALQGLAGWADPELAKVGVTTIAKLGDWKYAKWSEWISELAKFENTDFSSL